MRDGITLAGLGKPVAVIVQSIFERAARVHAQGAGCPDLVIVDYPHPPAGADAAPEKMAALAEEVRAEVVAALG